VADYIGRVANSDAPGLTAGRVRRRLGEEERRNQILAATVRAVAEHGYDGVSMARIAEHAGVSKGLISHYFADKNDLMARTATATVRAIRESMAAELDLSLPVPQVIRAALRRAAGLRATHRAELAALDQIVRNLRTPEGDLRLSLADYEETYRAQQVLFERGQAEGSLRPVDSRVLAVTYQGAIDTMLHYADVHPDADLEHYADTLADILLGGIENRDAAPPVPD
jgi:AcrR family transcriptional regulator